MRNSTALVPPRQRAVASWTLPMKRWSRVAAMGRKPPPTSSAQARRDSASAFRAAFRSELQDGKRRVASSVTMTCLIFMGPSYDRGGGFRRGIRGGVYLMLVTLPDGRGSDG